MMKRRTTMVVVVALCGGWVAAGCQTPARTVRPPDTTVPLYQDLGQHHRKVGTTSDLAQRYFDQGLIWAYAFNHDEAIRAFEQATRLDPQCAMAWWGIALCHGPHINNPILPPERAAAAWAALQKALVLKDQADPKERALIEALAERYDDPPPEDRRHLDQAYAEAMRVLWQSHRNDTDIGTLYAEALMDLRPWDLWTQDGQPQPGTEHLLEVLEDVLRRQPYHPGANHLYIHAVEASPQPQRADAAADRLRTLVPASGHLVHMPSHIDVLAGRWALASKQNEQAIEADRRYRRVSPRHGFYHVYMVHNHHMLAFAAMMEGRSAAALRAARDVVDSVPEDYLRREPALIDPFLGVVYDVLKRFGRWEELLREPGPPSYLPITTAMWRFNRGLAYAALGELEQADRERQEFRQAVANVPQGAIMSINPAKNILKIAGHVLDGEIAFNRGDHDRSIEHLRQAVALEDALLYMEPPEWIQPVRHTLGAVLLSAGRHDEAETVYRQDLEKWPGNGWSLYGLSRALRARNAEAEAAANEQRFRQAWSRADTRIASSCLCVPKT